MHHVISLNVAARGYTCYADDGTGGFAPQPLGVAGERVPPSAVEAAHAVDDALRGGDRTRTCALGWSAGEAPYAAIGLFLADAVDDKGRPGLLFVHVVYVDSPRELPSLVMGFAGLTAERAGAALAADIARCALDAGAVDALLARLRSALEATLAERRVSALLGTAAKIGVIEHDIAGAGTVAALAFALQESRSKAGWAVSDRVEGDRVVTAIAPARALRLSASSLLAQGLGASLAAAGRGAPPRVETGDLAMVGDDEKTIAEGLRPVIEEPAPRGPTAGDAPRSARAAMAAVALGAALAGGVAGAALRPGSPPAAQPVIAPTPAPAAPAAPPPIAAPPAPRQDPVVPPDAGAALSARPAQPSTPLPRRAPTTHGVPPRSVAIDAARVAPPPPPITQPERPPIE